MRELRPIDPLISNYPLPMSARRARFEAKRAHRRRLNLPKGHPYYRVPWWLPYRLAVIIARLRFGSTGRQTTSAPDNSFLSPGDDDLSVKPSPEVAMPPQATALPALTERAAETAPAQFAELLAPISVQDVDERQLIGIPFDEAGDGVELRLAVRDLMTLAAEFGDDSIPAAMARCERLDIAFIARLLQIGGMRGGQRHAIDIGRLDGVPVIRMAEVALGALELAATGHWTEPSHGGGAPVQPIRSQSAAIRLAGYLRRSDVGGPRLSATSTAIAA